MIGKAVCLLSGGIDSTTVLAIALSKGYDCTAISFDYGQRHSRELEASARVADHFHVKRHVVRMNLNEVTSSALTGQKDVETRALDHIEASIPNTYVPSRNIIFLSIAASMAESIGANNIFIGANAVDFSGYPDCRPEFISSMEKSLKTGLAFSPGLKIEAPLQEMSKAEIIKYGMSLGAPYELTHSCYLGNEEACGKCDSCLLRLKGFMEADLEDPVKYSHHPDFYKNYMEIKKGKKSVR